MEETNMEIDVKTLLEEISRRINKSINEGTLNIDFFVNYKHLPSGTRKVLDVVMAYYATNKKGVRAEDVSRMMKIEKDLAAGCLETLTLVGHLQRIPSVDRFFKGEWKNKYEPIKIEDNI